ncbi:hypothetical protein K7432_005323 [Basidiobolus ranarum]|uniref:Peroxin/Ferlin domain-containing protein n=1 Tax=Basidiobolus ranarum TaxID=34480 RepID=A0ABR2WWN2_9FUNG
MSISENDVERGLTVEVLFENQRGIWICGTPHFSHRMLNPFDCSPWTDKFQRYSPVDIHSAQLPDPNWVWADPYWYIDTSGDIDEDGWEYAFIFRSNSWHGDFRFFRSFVRRRKWVRHRKLKDLKPTFADRQMKYTTPNSPDRDEESIPSKSKGIIDKLKECRIDRERFTLIDDYLKSSEKSAVQEKIHDILCTLSYSSSRTRFMSMVNQRYPEIDISKYLNEFDFYSDYKAVATNS